MQKVFNLTNKYIVLGTPLILYSLISSIYLSVSANGKVINLIFAVILFTLMTAAFLAGWLYMIKLSVSEPERKDPNSLIKEFTTGVGEFFLSSLGGILTVFVLTCLLVFVSYFIGMHFIGDPGVTAESLSKALESPTELKAFVSALSVEQLTKINLWNILLLGFMSLTYYLSLLYFPTIFFINKNPLISFFISLKKLFSKKILITTGIFILIFITNFIISILSALFAQNLVLHFFVTLLNFYFITYATVGVFYYFYNTFVKSLIGQNIDTRA